MQYSFDIQKCFCSIPIRQLGVPDSASWFSTSDAWYSSRSTKGTLSLCFNVARNVELLAWCHTETLPVEGHCFGCFASIQAIIDNSVSRSWSTTAWRSRAQGTFLLHSLKVSDPLPLWVFFWWQDRLGTCLCWSRDRLWDERGGFKSGRILSEGLSSLSWCTSSSNFTMVYGRYIELRTWLVVWNMKFIFHNIWDVILPIDFQIFQDA